MWSEKYNDCLTYIDEYWDKIIVKPGQTWTNLDSHMSNFVQLPYAYIAPNHTKFTCLFYWDSYFLFEGIKTTKHAPVIQDTLANFTFLLENYGHIPNSNAHFALGRSQPPFLTSMIFSVIDSWMEREGETNRENFFSQQITAEEREWITQAIQTAKKEYAEVWIDIKRTHNHFVPGFALSKYGDTDVGYACMSELESGWDFTSRFYNRCNEFLPVDLNSLLYKYETDLAALAKLLCDTKEESYWQQKAQQRQKLINSLMWNEKTGFFYDYDSRSQTQSEFVSLAGFIPLWAGIASTEQAERMRAMLSHFETDFGLTITDKDSLAQVKDLAVEPEAYIPALTRMTEPKQWDYPNIWPPVEYLTVCGLLNYDLTHDAKRIMKKSVAAHAKLFREHKTFFEKINGETGQAGIGIDYKTQQGFGWTNAVFKQYISFLDNRTA